MIGRRIRVDDERRDRDRPAGREEHERAGDQRNPPAPQHDGAQDDDDPDDGDLTAHQHLPARVGEPLDQRGRQTERERPRGLLVTRRRRDAERGDEAEHRDEEQRFDRDGPRQASHGRAADLAVTEHGDEATAIARGEDERDRERDEFEHQEPAVRGPDEAGDVRDIRRGVHDARCREHEHADQRPAREASTRDHRVGARVRSALARRRAKQQRERRQRAGPDAGGGEMNEVHGHRACGARLGRGRVARGAREREREEREARGLTV